MLMKRFIHIFLLFCAMLAVTASCEQEMTFDGEAGSSDSRLVLYSLVVPGRPLAVEITRSVFAFGLHDGDFREGLDTLRGEVRAYVNGSEEPVVMEYDGSDDPASAFAPLKYVSSYIPKGGDNIRIVASFPGFPEASGETAVPAMNMSIHDMRRTDWSDGGATYEMIIRISDCGEGTRYYAVLPYFISTQHDYEHDFVIENIGVKPYPYTIESAPSAYGLAVEDLRRLFEIQPDVHYYFSNELFYGKTIDLKMSFDVGQNEMNQARRCWNSDNKDFRMEYKISVYLETFTESLYNHVMSRDIMTDVISSFLSEAPVMYSNVRGGLGTICSAACDTVNIILGADE